jgi:hypothetical protein
MVEDFFSLRKTMSSFTTNTFMLPLRGHQMNHLIHFLQLQYPMNLTPHHFLHHRRRYTNLSSYDLIILLFEILILYSITDEA